MASSKAQVIEEARDQVGVALYGHSNGNRATGDEPAPKGFWESILAVVLPMLLDAFKNCLKGPAAKKASQIDDEKRRLDKDRRMNRKERRAHKFAEKVLTSKEAIEANNGNELTDEEKDRLYEEAVQYAFENRNMVAKFAATK